MRQKASVGPEETAPPPSTPTLGKYPSGGQAGASSCCQSAGACQDPFTGHVECWDVVWRGLGVLFLTVEEHQIQEQVCPSHFPLLGLSLSVLSQAGTVLNSLLSRCFISAAGG